MRKKITATMLSVLLAGSMVPCSGWAEEINQPATTNVDQQAEGQPLEAAESPLEESFPNEVDALGREDSKLVASEQKRGEEGQSTLASESAVDIEWYTDDSEATEFYIGTAAELRGLSALVNGEACDATGNAIPAVSFQGATVYQDATILFDGDNASGFDPIGSPTHPFAGSYYALDGSRIEGLCVTGFTSNVGLFGYVSGSDSVLSNIVLAPDANGVGEIVVETATQQIENVGAVVGFTAGSLEGCSSSLTVRIASTGSDLSTAERQDAVRFVGGVAGYVLGDAERCCFSGLLDVTIASNVASEGSQSESLRVGSSLGGVVGRFGDPDNHGVMRNCSNEGVVFTRTTGSGSADRFGTTTYANIFFVGGVVGYSNGSIYDCSNGTYNPLLGVASGVVSTSSLDTPSFVLGGQTSGEALDNRGADQTGGVVGGLRSVSDDPEKYNDGDPDDPMYVVNCRNQGQVTGLCAVGGIVGEMGVYCYIEACYNGDPSDTTQVAGKVVSTRWNKPISGGVLGRTNGGTVSYCANYAEVRNIQTGYYMAGISGCLFVSDDHPEKTPEMYSCLNTGGVYTINTSSTVEYREAGICGRNEGYIHDCLSQDGSVPYHSNACIGDNDWGMFSNLESRPKAEIQSAESAAFLNAQAASDQDFTYYWFINGDGNPVLNAWVSLDESEKTPLTMGEGGTVASVEVLQDAPYVGGQGGSLPTLKVTLKNGTALVQNTDFYVIPQADAVAMTDEPAYSATVVGLGRYKGEMIDCVRYGIGASTLTDAKVRVSSMKYNGGKLVFPDSVEALLGTSVIDPAEYEYVIYSAHVGANAVTTGSGGCTVAFDSEGYVSYTADGADKVPVSEVGTDALNKEQRAFWLWDRNGEMIADSVGRVYYTTTSGGGTAGRPWWGEENTTEGLMRFVSATPAGYVVKVSAREGSSVLTGSALGSYVVNPVDIYRECEYSLVAEGKTWYWSMDLGGFYTLNEEGQAVAGVPSITFTGESLDPEVLVACQTSAGTYQLQKETDFRVTLGDPDREEAYLNRNVTDYAADPQQRACLTIRPVDTSRYKNYIVSFFEIDAADFADCVIETASDEWAYTGSAVEPEVKVSLNGVTLIEGVDYTVSYADNVEKGVASYTVNALENLQGGETVSYTGHFTISDGFDLSSLTLDEIADQQFNYGYDVCPDLVFRDASGAEVALTEGRDYVVSYSTTNVTKATGTNPNGRSIAFQGDSCAVTVSGVGSYTGQIASSFDIVPYDATANSTHQLRVTVQEMALSKWKNESQLPFNMGLNNPVVNVLAYPIVDWTAYKEGRFDEAYGEPLSIGSSTDKNKGSTINANPVRYYIYDETAADGRGALVSCDGAAISSPYESASGSALATVKAPANVRLTATVAMRIYTSGTLRNGAVGLLSVDEPFVVTEPRLSVRGDVNGNGVINIVDAQLAYDLCTGQYGENYERFSLPEGWEVADVSYAADVNADSKVDAADARAIQHYVHCGSWGNGTA